MNEDRELLQKSFREYAEKRVRPLAQKMAEELGKLGAEKVYSIEHARLADYRCDVYTEAIAKLVSDADKILPAVLERQ